MKFWSSPLSPLCDILVPLMYQVTAKQLLTSNFSKVRFFHFLKLSENTKTHGFLLYWQHLFKNPSVKYQTMWLYGTAASSCEKSRSWSVYALSDRADCQVVWFPRGGFCYFCFPRSFHPQLSFHTLSVHGLQCAFQVLRPFAVWSSVPVFSPEASLLRWLRMVKSSATHHSWGRS